VGWPSKNSGARSNIMSEKPNNGSAAPNPDETSRKLAEILARCRHKAGLRYIERNR